MTCSPARPAYPVPTPAARSRRGHASSLSHSCPPPRPAGTLSPLPDASPPHPAHPRPPLQLSAATGTLGPWQEMSPAATAHLRPSSSSAAASAAGVGGTCGRTVSPRPLVAMWGTSPAAAECVAGGAAGEAGVGRPRTGGGPLVVPAAVAALAPPWPAAPPPGAATDTSWPREGAAPPTPGLPLAAAAWSAPRPRPVAADATAALARWSASPPTPGQRPASAVPGSAPRAATSARRRRRSRQ